MLLVLGSDNFFLIIFIFFLFFPFFLLKKLLAIRPVCRILWRNKSHVAKTAQTTEPQVLKACPVAMSCYRQQVLQQGQHNGGTTQVTMILSALVHPIFNDTCQFPNQLKLEQPCKEASVSEPTEA